MDSIDGSSLHAEPHCHVAGTSEIPRCGAPSVRPCFPSSPLTLMNKTSGKHRCGSTFLDDYE